MKTQIASLLISTALFQSSSFANKIHTPRTGERCQGALRRIDEGAVTCAALVGREKLGCENGVMGSVRHYVLDIVESDRPEGLLETVEWWILSREKSQMRALWYGPKVSFLLKKCVANSRPE